MLDAIFVINLSFKTDRREAIERSLPNSLSKAVFWRAVHGDSVQHPSWWKSGRGAWGCYRSHAAILEHAMNEHLDSYLVLEDDAIFVSDFDARFEAYFNALPNDWEQAYLGGQLLYEIKNPPIQINDEVYMPYNVNRTHAFAVHKRGYGKLYEHLMTTPFHPKEHIDHHLGRLHEKRGIKVYCPSRWLVGQREDWSNISGKKNPTKFWPDPERCGAVHELVVTPKIVFLEAPKEVADELEEKHGWHQGNWKTGDGLDQGVCRAVASRDLAAGLKEWYSWVSREVIRDSLSVPCLYHPSLSINRVMACGIGEVIHVEASTVEEALGKYQCECTLVTQAT